MASKLLRRVSGGKNDDDKVAMRSILAQSSSSMTLMNHLPHGTVVHVVDDVYETVVDWKERVDQHSTADGSYYEVRLSHDVGVQIQMKHIRL